MLPQWWIYKTVHSAKSFSTFRTRLKTQLSLVGASFHPSLYCVVQPSYYVGKKITLMMLQAILPPNSQESG